MRSAPQSLDHGALLGARGPGKRTGGGQARACPIGLGFLWDETTRARAILSAQDETTDSPRVLAGSVSLWSGERDPGCSILVQSLRDREHANLEATVRGPLPLSPLCILVTSRIGLAGPVVPLERGKAL